MCGILGIVGNRTASDEAQAHYALDLMKHRGPDATGIWADQYVWMGQNRLSIVDLSSAGSQPMVDSTGQFRIIFNGEIYNYKEIRREIDIASPRRWVSDSDTEVVMEAFKYSGVSSLRKLNGMWAIAIYDSEKRKIFLSRDRYGVKPLYWAMRGETLMFASEIKSLLAMGVDSSPDWTQIASYLRGHGCDAGEYTAFSGIHALHPGFYMTLDTLRPEPSPAKYWDLLEERVTVPERHPERVEAFQEIFEDAVRLRLRSDVDTGVALSGGLDSSSVYGAARVLQGSGDVVSATSGGLKKFQLFSVTNRGSAIDESQWVQDCLDFWNDNEHVSWISPDPDSFVDMIDEVIWHQEAPVWSSAVFAFHSMYKHISETGTRVILEGHGSDEMFGGYPHLAQAAANSYSRRLNPIALWNVAGALQETLNPDLQQVRSSRMGSFLASHPFTKGAVDILRGRRNASMKEAAPIGNKYISRQLASIPAPHVEPTSGRGTLDVALKQAFSRDILPIVLRVVDRASMAHSVESRAPFMDYRVVQFVFSLSEEERIGRHTKQLLRDAAVKWAPSSVIDRTAKMGFAIDSPQWFRSPGILDYLSDTFRTSRAVNSSVIDSAALVHDIDAARISGFTWAQSAHIWEALNIHLWEESFFGNGLASGAGAHSADTS